MLKIREKYVLGTIDLYDVRNRNEVRVIRAMRNILDSLGNPEIEEQLLFDAYALALNQLEARYVQRGSIVLRDPVTKDELNKAVTDAMHRVLKNPKQ